MFTDLQRTAAELEAKQQADYQSSLTRAASALGVTPISGPTQLSSWTNPTTGATFTGPIEVVPGTPAPSAPVTSSVASSFTPAPAVKAATQPESGSGGGGQGYTEQQRADLDSLIGRVEQETTAPSPGVTYGESFGPSPTPSSSSAPSTPSPSSSVSYGESFGPSWNGPDTTSSGGGSNDYGGGGGSSDYGGGGGFGEHSDPGAMGWADGGHVTGRAVSMPRPGGVVTGPGGPTDDLITDRLSNGEFVMPAEATARYLPQLEAMRQDGLDARDDAAGGMPVPMQGRDIERTAAMNGDTSGYDPSPLAPPSGGALTPDTITARMQMLSPEEMQILGQGMGPEFAGIMMKILGPAYAAVVRGAMGGGMGAGMPPAVGGPGGGAARLSTIVA
jgi:hypothetical protein